LLSIGERLTGDSIGRRGHIGVAVMNINTALGKLARDQAESGDVKTSADDLAALLQRLSDVPTHEIEKLIDALQALRKQLQNAGNRIQRDIAEYAN
jgi:predicted trehalose synthase